MALKVFTVALLSGTGIVSAGVTTTLPAGWPVHPAAAASRHTRSRIPIMRDRGICSVIGCAAYNAFWFFYRRIPEPAMSTGSGFLSAGFPVENRCEGSVRPGFHNGLRTGGFF